MDQFNDVTTTGKSRLRLLFFERYKILSLVFVVLLCLVIALIIAVIVLAVRTGNPLQNDVCLKRSCITTASTIIKQINESFDPCENFYDFVCKNWMEQNPVEEDGTARWLTEMSSLQMMVNQKAIEVLEEASLVNDPPFAKKVRTFFKSCTNGSAIANTNLTEYLPLVSTFGGWPVLDPNWDGSTFHWMIPAGISTYMNPRNLHNVLPRGYLLGVQVDRDTRDRSKYIIYVGYTQDLDSPVDDLFPDTASYVQFAMNVLHQLGANSGILQQDMLDVAHFQQQLLGLGNSSVDSLQHTSNRVKENLRKRYLEEKHMDPEERDELFTKMTINDLYTRFGSDIDWLEYINAVLGVVNTQAARSTPVLVAVSPYLKHLNDLIAKTPDRTLANYLMWRIFIDNFYDAMPDLTTNKQNTKSQAVVTEARNQICLQSTNKYMGKQAGRLYIDKHLNLKARNDVMLLKDKIREALKNIMEEADWMDKTTKDRAIDKLMKVYFSVGYSQDLMDDNLLNQLTGDDIFYEDKYVMNKLNSAVSSNKLWFTQYRNNGGILDKIRSINDATSVNAAYVAAGNWIEVNAAFINPPLYDFDYNDALKYGLVGFMIGHELTHGFDSKGKEYDADGNLRDWWTAGSNKNYNNRAQCLINQYSNYLLQEANENVNGNLTLGENIADNGGVKAAYRAYKLRVKKEGPEKKLPGLESYTPNQLFFIGYAKFFCQSVNRGGAKELLKDVHSPNIFRVLGPLSNYDEFSKAFKCPAGSKYNPAKKCAVW